MTSLSYVKHQKTKVRNEALVNSQIIDLVMRERKVALSNREWKHRLAGFGYGIKETTQGMIIETLPHGVEICPLPAELAQ